MNAILRVIGSFIISNMVFPLPIRDNWMQSGINRTGLSSFDHSLTLSLTLVGCTTHFIIITRNTKILWNIRIPLGPKTILVCNIHNINVIIVTYNK